MCNTDKFILQVNLWDHRRYQVLLQDIWGTISVFPIVIKFMRKSPLWTNEQMQPGPRTSADLGVLKINGVGSVCWKSQFIKNAWQEITMRTLWNHVRSGRNGRRFVDDIFFIHFLQWKCSDFEKSFIEMHSLDFNWWWSGSIGSGCGLVPSGNKP